MYSINKLWCCFCDYIHLPKFIEVYTQKKVTITVCKLYLNKLDFKNVSYLSTSLDYCTDIMK